MAAAIYEPTGGALSRTPILCKAEDAAIVLRFELSIKVWRGDVANVPASPSYELTKYPDQNNTATFDISQLLQGEFSSDYETVFTEFTPNTGQVIWVECTYTIVGESTSQQIVGTPFLVFNGYGEFSEGVNPISPLIASSQSSNIFLNESSPYFLALSQINLAFPVETVDVRFDIGGSQNYVNTNINLDLSQNNLLYMDISPSLFAGLYDKGYEVVIEDTDGEEVARINVEVECEPKYTPATIAFLNKNGAWDYLTFSKAMRESIQVESGEYTPYILDTTFGSAPSYNTFDAQTKKYDINAVQSVTFNTTFLPEPYFDTIKQLMMSSQCVWVENGLSVNPSTMNMSKKFSVNKEMVQYTVEFTHASLTQSTVR